MYFKESIFSDYLNEDQLVMNLKRHLMSRDNRAKREATQYLLNYLLHNSSNGKENQTARDILIEADIVEYLGEAMATHDSMLLGDIFTCLELFLPCKKFATQSRAAYVIECIQRTMFFLFKNTKMELVTVNQALSILAICIEEFHKTLSLIQLFGSNANIKQMLYFVSCIQKKKEELNDETVINSCLLFLSLLSQNDSALKNVELLHDVSEITKKCLTSLAILSYSKDLEDMTMNISVLMVKIGAAVLQYCQGLVIKNKVEIDFEIDQQESFAVDQSNTNFDVIKSKEKILSCILPFTKNLWVSYILKLELNKDTLEIHFNVLQCIKYLYKIDDLDIKSFSEYLAKEGFIILLPMTLNWSKERKLKSFVYLICDIIIEFISSLSEEFLGLYDDLSVIDFKKYFIQGICSLPTNFCDWLYVLNNQDVSDSCKHFVIIFFYFFCLFLPGSPSDELNLPCLINYLVDIATKSCPLSVLKAFWFLYSAAFLCQASSLPVDLIYKSTNILLNLIESVSCGQLYTHHPAILFWTFSCPGIPTKFQYKVLYLWLQKENEENYDGVLLKMAFANEEVLFRLMDMVKYAEREIAHHGAVILGKAIISENEKSSENVVCLLWDTLPSVLSEYCSGNSDIADYNITYYMQTTSIITPSVPNSKLLLQCAKYIMKVLSAFKNNNNNTIELRAPAIKIALLNLLMAMKKRDLRVLLSYTEDEEFLKFVYHSSGYSRPKLIRPCIQLLMHVNKFLQQSPDHLCQTRYCLHVDVLHVLYLLIQDDYEILMNTLEFLYEMLTSQLPNPAMVIVSPGLEYVASPFLQVLFWHLQNMCSKNVLGAAKNCLKAMGSILMYAYELHPDKSLYPKLTTQPWTHTVLRILFISKKPPISSELLFFICWWMQYYLEKNRTCKGTSNIRSRIKSRAPYPSLLTDTAERISEALIGQTQSKDQDNNTLILIVLHRIVLLNVSISQEVLQTLKNKLAETKLKIPADLSSTFWGSQIPKLL